MHNFDYGKLLQNVTGEMIETIAAIYEYKGQQNLFLNTQADKVSALFELAKIDSVNASNKIDGISIAEERLKQLALDKTVPQNTDEKNIAGYRNALNSINENYAYIPVSAAYILQLHKDLYVYGGDIGGKYRTGDSVADYLGIQPVKASEVFAALGELCSAYVRTAELRNVNSLLIVPAFILGFLCISPFNCGNGRLSRLLTALLLYRSGFYVGKYVSLEKKIEQTKEEYFAALSKSLKGWNENANDYAPFTNYLLGVLLSAYREFNEKAHIWGDKPLTKPQRIIEIIKNNLRAITKSEIKKQCPDIAEITVQRTLAELVERDKIQKLGGGRYTKYIWKNERS